MCRIAGIINNRLTPEAIQGKVRQMCHALQHGGPDDEGLFYDEANHLAFGHRRLTIIDLSRNGHQPMADSEQKVWITFNGEIYNYLELKEQLLKLGAKFRSATDTEVIIAAYLQWGTAAFGKLRGMFAFALFDKVKNQTFLVRDTAGIKPLYYFASGKQLSFASEIRAFTAAGITSEEDPGWPIRFLAFGHIPEPYTTLKGVFSLPKGHYLCRNNTTSTISITSYRQTVLKDRIINPDEAGQMVSAGLMQAVKRQLTADAPLGVFLSGGTDSSLLTLLADQEKKEQLKTISIYFNEKNYNEQAYQNEVLTKTSSQNFSHLVTKRDLEIHLPQIISAMDMPTTDGINSWFISKYAHEDGLKTVLSGIGADEYFGGYPSFNRISYLGYLRKLPPFAYSAFKGLLPDAYKKLTLLANNSITADYLFLRGLFTPGDISQILDADEKQVNALLFSDHLITNAHSYNQEHAAWLETNFYMQNQLLRDTDVMSMSHGLEVRVPFLDEDLTAIVERIAAPIRFDRQKPKKLLIDSFNGLLPATVWNRPKMGFTFPLQQWMRQHTTISDVSLYKGKQAKSIIKNFKNNKVHWSKAFALYQVQNHI